MASAAPRNDEFDNAFDVAAAAVVDGIAPVPVETPPASETPPAETPSAETPPAPAETSPAETPPAPAETPPAETPPVPAETPPAETPPPAPTTDDIVKGLAEVLKNQTPPAPAETPAAPAPEAEAPPIYTAQENEVISNYEKNWPDVSRAESLKRRAEYHDMLKYVFTEVVKYVDPLQAQMRLIGNTLHTSELKQAVPDYSEDLETAVAGWVETQPGYLQTGMKQVMQSGTSEEVADLIRRYRESQGVAPATPAAPAAVVPTPPQATPPKTELSSAAKQAAESLAPVSAERSAVPQGEDPQDYDTAFSKYAATMPTI